jgi:hydroxymethylpyrimidine/phosphomethylpyrimidine kinase
MRNGACPQILLAVRTALAPLRSLLGGPGGRSEALEGRVEFEPTTPGLEVRNSTAKPPTHAGLTPTAQRRYVSLTMVTVMTIAGSDSSGGAGVQADLKTFAALGVYGTCAITAITAQDSQRVHAVHEIPPELVAAQIDAIVLDIGADAVKTGMLASAEIVRTVAAKVEEHRLPNIVIDPVMVAKSGASLLAEDALAVLKSDLLPLATAVTPNLPEAEVLTGRRLESDGDLEAAAHEIAGLGARAVVITGGHASGPEAVDLLYDGRRFRRLAAPRLATRHGRGTGCTFAAAVAAGLAQGMAIEEAVGQAKDYVTAALARAVAVGKGPGPLHHFHRWWSESA